MIAFWGVISMVTWALVGWLPTYYKEHFDLSQSIAGLYATGYLYPASIAGLLLGGFLADRYSRSNNKARIVVTVVGLCIAAPSVFIAASTDIIALAVVCFILYIITKSFSDTNTMPILCLVVDPGYRATAYGILNLFGCLLGGIGLYLSGWLHDRHVHLGQIYQVGAFLLLGGAILLFMVRPRFKEA
jgi:MFS family permease